MLGLTIQVYVLQFVGQFDLFYDVILLGGIHRTLQGIEINFRFIMYHLIDCFVTVDCQTSLTMSPSHYTEERRYFSVISVFGSVMFSGVPDQ